MTKAAAKHTDIKDMTFERALKELESIVSRLERGDVELEESIIATGCCGRPKPRSRS
jgi:exodeoxyribonuclease VII small subunit